MSTRLVEIGFIGDPRFVVPCNTQGAHMQGKSGYELVNPL
jgi:hypothetical protein